MANAILLAIDCNERRCSDIDRVRAKSETFGKISRCTKSPGGNEGDFIF
jgi:hypothetical protein